MITFRSALVSVALALALSGCSPDRPLDVVDAAVVCDGDLECDDGVFCNGLERCAPADPDADSLGCADGPRPECEHGCDELTDRCGDAPCADADDDGFTARTCGGDDCDDAEPRRHPSATEVCDAEDLDEDCDPLTIGPGDLDGDGYTDDQCCNGSHCGDDCDDEDPGSHPTEAESCDGADNDCDGVVDERVLLTFYGDTDRDGAGDPARSITACAQPDAYVENSNDCDDTRSSVSRGAPEICDVLDNDCDTDVDEDTVVVPWYLDADGDLFGSSLAPAIESCAPIAGRVQMPGDCDDTRVSRHPAATETCNGIDDDCDPEVDEGVRQTFHRDADGDGFGDPTGATLSACAPSGGYVANDTDCDDSTHRRNPGLTEVCDDVPDNDCSPTTFTFDADRDGADALSCGGRDCDDTRDAIRPGATELCDRLDNDCSTGGGALPSEDADGDGFAPLGAACAGGPRPRTDCDDARADVSPTATEICNGRDDECDGMSDESPEAQASCNRTGTIGSCASGACTIAACTGSYANCDGIAGNGCEANLDTSSASCGACGSACPSGASCVGRICQCPAGQVTCAGACVDLRTDARHCGACASACPGGATCASSTCRCPFGWILCGGACVDPSTSVQHCGGCGRSCLGGSCAGGMCECAGAMGELCSGVCHDLSVDLDHCGACGEGCRAGSCAGGTCTCPPARPTVCGGTCIDTIEDEANCGACGRDCGAAGVCQASACDAIVGVEVGYQDACAVRASGQVACWGFNAGPSTYATSMTGVSTLAEHFGGRCILDAAGNVDCQGRFPPLTGVAEIVGGPGYVCARLHTQEVRCVGENAHGTLGDGTFVDRSAWVTPIGLPAIRALGIMGHLYGRTCAVTTAGALYCWGECGGGSMACGPSSRIDERTPVLVPGITDAIDVAGAGFATCVVRAGGTVECLGDEGSYGLLGDGPGGGARGAPAPVPGLAGVVDLSGGRSGLICALRATGRVWCWGSNAGGGLGAAYPDSSSPSPVEVRTIDDAIAISVEGNGPPHACALRARGDVWCWGDNLGTDVPVRVEGLTPAP